MTEGEIPGMEVKEPDEKDSRIVVFMEGQTSTPKYVDFHKVSPFQLIAIGEWLSLKGKQMIAVTEQGEADSGLIVPQMGGQLMKDILEVNP